MPISSLHSRTTAKALAFYSSCKRLPSAINALIIFFVAALCPTLSHGQVTYLSTTTGLSSGSTITVSHTTSTASNRLMLVGISHSKDDATINTVTYGGVELTAQGTAQASDFRTRIYSLVAPVSGTANVVVTFSANVSKGAIASVSTYSGVNQTTPLGTLAAASGDSNAPSLAVASVSGDIVHDVVASETGSGTITVGAAQTLNATDPGDQGITRNRSSRETATGTSTTMSYSFGSGKKWSISGVAIKRAPLPPVISVSGTLAAVNTVFGSASPSPSSFTVSGTNMTAGITVTPPTGFQVSTVLGSGYANSIVVGSSGTIASTTIFVRLVASTAVGNYSGNIVLSSTGATNQTIATASSVVSKATPTITTAPTATAITFGQTLANSTLGGGAGSVAGSFAFTTPSTAPNAGTAAQGFTFTPTDSANYNTASGTVTVTVAKANSTVTTAPTATAITFGQTLASSTLTGGNASTAGTFAFTTPATAPNAGTASQSVTFTPSNTTNFNTTTTTVSVTVAKATPTVTTVPTASSITFGQTLASSTLSGGAGSVAGSFAFTTPSTAPSAGTAAQGFTFTPTDSANYNNATGTVNVAVAKATPTVTTAPTASAITFGQTLASSTLSGGVGSVAGSFAFTTPSTAPNAGTAAQGFTFTPTDSANYNTATGTVSVMVTPLSLTITADASSKAIGGAEPTLTYSSSGLLAGDSITGSLSRASGETTGSYPITLGTLSAGSNYTISFTGANFVITGLMAMADAIQKPSAITAMKIPVAGLLANDGTLNAGGVIVAAPNLTITAAQTSLGAALAIRGEFILFMPSTTEQETLTYTVSNGTATSTATVTLTSEAAAPPFTLELIKRGTAAVSGGSTSVTHDFLGVPNQTYRIQYSTDLSTWTTAPDQSSGATGSFSVTFTQSGDLAAAWNSQMFFRATKP